jgi:hypothetical protein
VSRQDDYWIERECPVMSPEGLRPFLANLEDVAHYVVRGAQADVQADSAPGTLALLNRLLALPDVAALTDSPPTAELQAPVLPMLFQHGNTTLSPLQHDSHPGHTARRDVAGSAHRVLVSNGRCHGSHHPLARYRSCTCPWRRAH